MSSKMAGIPVIAIVGVAAVGGLILWKKKGSNGGGGMSGGEKDMAVMEAMRVRRALSARKRKAYPSYKWDFRNPGVSYNENITFNSMPWVRPEPGYVSHWNPQDTTTLKFAGSLNCECCNTRVTPVKLTNNWIGREGNESVITNSGLPAWFGNSRYARRR